MTISVDKLLIFLLAIHVPYVHWKLITDKYIPHYFYWRKALGYNAREKEDIISKQLSSLRQCNPINFLSILYRPTPGTNICGEHSQILLELLNGNRHYKL